MSTYSLYGKLPLRSSWFGSEIFPLATILPAAAPDPKTICPGRPPPGRDLFAGRLRQAEGLRDLGPQLRPYLATGNTPFQKLPANSPIFKDSSVTGWDLLQRQRPTLAERLSALRYQAELIADSNAQDPKLVRILLHDRNANANLTIPLVDEATGSVLWGDNYRQAAYRSVWQPKASGALGETETFALDEWLARQATTTQDWKSLNQFSDRVIVGSLDKMNQWKWKNQPESQMAVLRPDAIQAISQQAVVAPGKLFGGKSFDELTTAEALPWFQAIYDPDKGWGSPIGGEKPYVNGTVVSRQAQQQTFMVRVHRKLRCWVVPPGTTESLRTHTPLGFPSDSAAAEFRQIPPIAADDMPRIHSPGWREKVCPGVRECPRSTISGSRPGCLRSGA